jgi:hypothetical protein
MGHGGAGGHGGYGGRKGGGKKKGGKKAHFGYAYYGYDDDDTYAYEGEYEGDDGVYSYEAEMDDYAYEGEVDDDYAIAYNTGNTLDMNLPTNPLSSEMYKAVPYDKIAQWRVVTA